jgi:hypothetical protein
LALNLPVRSAKITEAVAFQVGDQWFNLKLFLTRFPCLILSQWITVKQATYDYNYELKRKAWTT